MWQLFNRCYLLLRIILDRAGYTRPEPIHITTIVPLQSVQIIIWLQLRVRLSLYQRLCQLLSLHDPIQNQIGKLIYEIACCNAQLLRSFILTCINFSFPFISKNTCQSNIPYSYNGSQSLRNGLSSPSSRSKYSQLDQSSPVNLAVSQSMQENGALVLGHKSNEVAALCAAAKPSSLESEQDAISSSIASLYQHKMPYCPPSIPDATASLYYPNFYPRPTSGSVYG